MGLEQRQWARQQRLKLRRILQMRCWACGSRDYRKLEFDCLIPQGDKHHKIEWSWRMSFYRSQFLQHNLGLLCSKCNSKKGDSIDFPMPFKPDAAIYATTI